MLFLALLNVVEMRISVDLNVNVIIKNRTDQRILFFNSAHNRDYFQNTFLLIDPLEKENQ